LGGGHCPCQQTAKEGRHTDGPPQRELGGLALADVGFGTFGQLGDAEQVAVDVEAVAPRVRRKPASISLLWRLTHILRRCRLRRIAATIAEGKGTLRSPSYVPLSLSVDKNSVEAYRVYAILQNCVRSMLFFFYVFNA